MVNIGINSRSNKASTDRKGSFHKVIILLSVLIVTLALLTGGAAADNRCDDSTRNDTPGCDDDVNGDVNADAGEIVDSAGEGALMGALGGGVKGAVAGAIGNAYIEFGKQNEAPASDNTCNLHTNDCSSGV